MTKKPFFREFDGWWYAQIREGSRRKQVKLVKCRDKEEDAYPAFHKLMAQDPTHFPGADQPEGLPRFRHVPRPRGYSSLKFPLGGGFSAYCMEVHL